VISYIVRRVVMAVVIIYVVVTLSFFMVRLMPGNPMDYLEAQLERQGNLTPQQVQEKVQAIYGLLPNEPLWKQYLQYISQAARGNLGTSLNDPGQTVLHIIAGALPWTIFSVGIALIVSFVIGIAVAP
jgi:peptide/nickel transport system permease protein